MLRVMMVTMMALGLMGSANLWAGPENRTPGVTKRQHHQGHRIGQGVRSGQLTREEAQGLREGQREVREMKRDAKSDGVVTQEERKGLHRKLNEESRDIYEAKHDDETRPAGVTPGVSHRQHRQGHRIGQGIRSGELTREEAQGLREGQREVREMKRDAKSDGVVTQEERKGLHQKLNEESRDIYEEKHDGESR